VRNPAVLSILLSDTDTGDFRMHSPQLSLLRRRQHEPTCTCPRHHR
jgi:hypothetical protein